MKTLAVDGGSLKVGIAVIEDLGPNNLKLVHAERFHQQNKKPFFERCFCISERVSEVIEQHQPDIVVLEDIKFSKSASIFGSLAKVCYATGAIGAAMARDGYEPILIPASVIKSRLGIKNKRDKSAVLKIVNKRFAKDLVDLGYPNQLQGKKHEDVSDAVALAWVGRLDDEDK